MNETKIDNIISAGGIEGWNHKDNMDVLTKTFSFNTFEKANHFV